VNLGILPYLLSKIVILGVLCLVQCGVLLGIMSLAAHFYSGIFLPSIWEIYITLSLTSLAGVMVGLTISALVRNNDQAMSFVPLVLIPQLIFSGTLFVLKGYPLQIFGALFSLRWSMAALGSIVNLPENGDKIFGTCDACSTYQHNGHYLLFTWLTLTATILILGLLTGYFLKRKDAGR
jgi:ABC transport system ATP-binding/permease protein